MARTEQILPLTGPMLDVIDRDALGTEKGLVRKRVNLRPDLTGNTFANLPIPGTVAAAMVLPAGENKTLGWCNDNENEAIIWCVWNANQAHSVFRFFTLKDEVQRVFYNESTLGFTADTNISCEVIDGRFYWNDNAAEPKSFNIEKAVNYTNGTSGDAYTESDKPFNTKVFPYCKKPPRFKPEIEYVSLTEDPDDSTPIDFNNLRKKQWQFKYSYVYEDDQESAYSPISVIEIPESEVSTSGDWIEEITVNNAIKVTVNTGSNNVKKINVAVRDATNRNILPFYTFTEIEKETIQNDGIHSVYFLNNTRLDSIDNDYGNAYYHDVPLAAKDLILLDGKYVAMSMPKIGYDFDEKDLDYSIESVVTPVEFDESSVRFNTTYERAVDSWNQCGKRGFGRVIIKIHIPEKFYKNSTYSVTIRRPEPYSDVSVFYNSPATEPANYPEVVRDNLISQLNAEIDKCETDVPILIRPITTEPGGIRIDFHFFEITLSLWTLLQGLGYSLFEAINYNDDIKEEGEKFEKWDAVIGNSATMPSGAIVSGTFSPAFTGLKKFQYHPFAVVYNDGNGRYNVAFGDKKIYAPGSTTIDEVVNAKITINSQPPEWADTYRIAYIPYNSYIYTLSVPAVEVLDDTNEDVPSGYSFLKINQAITKIQDAFPNAVIEAYVWQNGDRLRQIGKTQSYEILKEHTREYTVDTDTMVETGYLVDATFDTVGSPDKVEAIEIYRPNLTPQEKVYYEIGEEYKILNPGTAARYHEGNTQSQTSSLPAIIDLDFGDIYLRKRLSGDPDVLSITVEDNSLSDYYISNGISIGRGVVRTELKQEVLKRVVKSENYIENTELNRLNIMLPGSENYSVSEVYGDISRIVERGDTLKIIQAHKEISVYIGKNYAKDGVGGDIILNTDNTFGSDTEYVEYLGCKRPRAIGTMGRNVYFFDEMTADWCRSAVNGTISLTKQYGFDKYFSQKAKEFREYTGSKNILFGCEPDLQTIYLTFIVGSSAETVAFSENTNNQGFLFIAEFSNGPLIPEYHAWYGEYLYSFVNGRLFTHGTGQPNSFFGSARKTAVLETVTNQYPQIRKTFEFMSLDANGQWNAEFEIEADNNYTSIQKTKILSPMFLNREGVLTSSVPRNLINGNGTEDINRLYDGNKMSGNAMKIKISSANFDILRNLTMTAITQK